jgi:hypothetical protein
MTELEHEPARKLCRRLQRSRKAPLEILAGLFTVAALLLLIASLAHAESVMEPLSQDGHMVDSLPPPPWATQEERLKRLERAATAYCLQGYHLEHRSTGLVCVRPAQ